MGQRWHTQTQPMSYVASSREDAALPAALSSAVDIELLASVIVPVRNGGSGLAELVEALAAQTLARDRFEVLVADDGSSDGATEGLGTGDGWLRVLLVHRSTRMRPATAPGRRPAHRCSRSATSIRGPNRSGDPSALSVNGEDGGAVLAQVPTSCSVSL